MFETTTWPNPELAVVAAAASVAGLTCLARGEDLNTLSDVWRYLGSSLVLLSEWLALQSLVFATIRLPSIAVSTSRSTWGHVARPNRGAP